MPVFREEEFAPFPGTALLECGQEPSHEDAIELVQFVDAYPYYVQKLAMLHFDLAGESDQALQATKRRCLEMELPGFEAFFLG